MDEKIKKYLGYLPGLVPIVYFLGYILINGYLNNFGYTDYSILNITYLKAGVLITILLTIIFLNAWFCFDKETMTDNYKKSWKSLLLIFYNILFINFLLCLYLVGFKLFNNNWVIILIGILCILFLMLFRVWSDNKSPKNNIGYFILIIPGVILLLIIDVIFAFNNTLARYLIIFNITTTVFITLSLGVFGDNNYKSRIITDFIILIVICFVFGNKIYGLLPYKIGGGEPYKIVVNNNCLTNNENINSDTLNVIYENEDKFIFFKDSTVFIVSRNEIKCYYLIK